MTGLGISSFGGFGVSGGLGFLGFGVWEFWGLGDFGFRVFGFEVLRRSYATPVGFNTINQKIPTTLRNAGQPSQNHQNIVR